MTRFLRAGVVFVALFPARAAPASDPGALLGARVFEATYVGTIAPLPPGAKRADVWIRSRRAPRSRMSGR